jgi:glycosyltransferase involved in cell wall biosynthesis
MVDLSICVTVKDRSRVPTEYGVLSLLPDMITSLREALDPADAPELIISDWASTDWPVEEWLDEYSGWLPVNLIRMQHTGFSRGLGLNVAAQNARGALLCFLDADMLVPKSFFLQARETVARGYAFFPVCQYFLDHMHTQSFWAVEGYGSCVLSRIVWEASTGWPVHWRWGSADTIFVQRVQAHVSIDRPQLPGFIHQWHPPSVPRSRLVGQEGAPLKSTD